MSILGNISGLFGALISVLSIIVSPLTKLTMSLDIINSLFSVESKKQENENRAKLKLIRSSDVQQVKVCSSLRKMYSAKFDETQDDFIKNVLKQKNKQFAVDGLDRLRLICQKKRRK